MKSKFIFATALIWIMGGGNLLAGKYETKEIVYPADDIKLLVVGLDIGVANIQIQAKDIDDIVNADVRYETKRIKISSDYEKSGDTGYLDLASSTRKKFHMDSKHNRWNIILSTKYETELLADFGACEVDADLGGLPLAIVDLDIGAAEGSFDFSKPNPIIAEKVIIDAGAAEIDFKNLGNANFRRLRFNGGAGSFEFDFSGKYTQKSRATISIGIGKVVIYIPTGLPVRIEADEGFLSSIEFENTGDLEVDDGHCESDDFDESNIGLELEVDVVLGSVEIIWID